MHDREAVVAATDLAALADSLVGPSSPGPAGATWRCPDGDHTARSDEQPQFVVYRTRRGDQRWQCTSCGAGGTAVELVATAMGVDVGDALEVLAHRLAADGAKPLPVEGGARGAGPSPVPAAPSVDRWVGRAAELLWSPFGNPVRRWLGDDRGLPEDLLRFHRVGATSVTPSDQLPTRRAMPGRRASSPAAVLPVLVRGRAVRAQLRLVDPPSPEERYVNPPSLGAGTPVGLFRPPRRRHPEIVVTEGILDAFAANAAGYRAVAVLAPGRADTAVAHQLARLDGPLVLAFDPDDAGSAASRRLEALLTARGRPPATMNLPGTDLNESLVGASNWPRWLAAHVGRAVADVAPVAPGRAL